VTPGSGHPGYPGRRPLSIHRAGLVPYGDGLRLQEDLVARRRGGDIPDTLVLLEHPHVITMGSSSDVGHVLLGEAEREAAGVELYEAGRGGDVTYHGPGQLVAYPIIDLKPDRKDLHAYLRDLEEVMIHVAATFGVSARRREGLTGAWTDRGKLAAIGVRVSSQWIASHGAALNVSADLGFFDAIVPCGLEDEGVTSLERELGSAVSVEEASQALAERFAEVFDREIIIV
jgi:lipoyl(octanoyl) transferase